MHCHSCILLGMAVSSEAYVHVSRREGTSTVRTGPSTAVPALFTAEIDDPAQPYTIEMQVRTDVGRRPAIVDLRLELRDRRSALGVTTQGLRHVHVARALEMAVHRAIEPLTEEADDELERGTPRRPVQTDGSEAAAKPLRGIPVTDSFLTRVAEVYRSAVASGSRSPVVEVSRQLGGSRSTAGRWVLQARRAGILRPSLGTTAGEATKARVTRGSRR